MRRRERACGALQQDQECKYKHCNDMHMSWERVNGPLMKGLCPSNSKSGFPLLPCFPERVQSRIMYPIHRMHTSILANLLTAEREALEDAKREESEAKNAYMCICARATGQLESAIHCLSQRATQNSELRSGIAAHVSASEPMRSFFAEKLKEIEQLECLRDYLSVARCLQALRSRLGQATTDPADSLTAFLELEEIIRDSQGKSVTESASERIQQLTHSRFCWAASEKLGLAARTIATQNFSELLTAFRTQLKTKLITLGWPEPVDQSRFSAASLELSGPLRALLNLQFSHCHLFSGSTPETLSWSPDGIDDASSAAHLWATRALSQPIAARFYHHFHVVPATKRIDKPEWYFSHALKLIESHGLFISHILDPLLPPFAQDNPSVPSASLDFTRVLVQVIHSP